MSVTDPPPPELVELADHIEFEHERELAPTGEAYDVLLARFRAMHAQMHAERDDWGHTHERTP